MDGTTRGEVGGTQLFQRELAAVLLCWEGAPDTAFFRAQAWRYLVELPEGAQTTAEDDAPRFLVEVTVPQGALSERRKAGLVEEAIRTVLEAAGLSQDDACVCGCSCTNSPTAPGARAAPSSATPTSWPW